jgi:hypothetical protein
LVFGKTLPEYVCVQLLVAGEQLPPVSENEFEVVGLVLKVFV